MSSNRNSDDFTIRPLSAELELRAQQELGEVPDRVPEDIEAMRTWISKQPHLKARDDAQFLVAFLRGCKYSLEKTKLKLDNFYAMRGAVPELYKNRFVGDKQLSILKTGCLLRLSEPLQPDGPRIHISRYAYYDSNQYSIAEVMQVNTMLGEIQIREDDNAMVSGFVEIIDMKGVTAGHMFQFDAMLIKKLAVLGDKALPYRPKGFHFINAPSIAEKAMSIAKSLMSDKIRKRFHIHSKLDTLYKYVPKECLPVEYGGTNGNIQNVVDTWTQKLIDYTEFFQQDAGYGTNEKLRQGQPINSETLFGIEGSFRKLDID
ncbi:alpha-tocopherol transfer protein [Drosophila grimshawi]|uniref:GH22856 n=1 Tax=Drosophila grimshawi TaxID=7222 RepID=B4JVX5_DROGR|nr:alpha-tocopherol transfer protein [Drosophila grimshawi]XP_032596890.1 alpha-tocopherol transfer protein [Drosophila grimshawi]EDV98113.1 GH22856 [Drosophila grimshawi]